MRVAVTGATGRLGRALVQALEDAPFTGPSGPTAWTRSAFDLDAPAGIGDLLDRDRPDVVVHAAAWTDVDGCARNPALAMARNGEATGALADACASRGIDLVAISTNEVFDGRRTDGRPYEPEDPTAAANPYGASKLAGEELAREAYRDRSAMLGIVRTAWLFGPPGRDFPRKIADAAEAAARDGVPLRVVADEWGTPSYAADVADAIIELLADDAHAGVHHLVGTGIASRADWARDIVARLGVDVTIQEVPGSTWQRASTPPSWAVLAPTPLPSGEPIRPWTQAMADYAPALRRASADCCGQAAHE